MFNSRYWYQIKLWRDTKEVTCMRKTIQAMEVVVKAKSNCETCSLLWKLTQCSWFWSWSAVQSLKSTARHSHPRHTGCKTERWHLSSNGRHDISQNCPIPPSSRAMAQGKLLMTRRDDIYSSHVHSKNRRNWIGNKEKEFRHSKQINS